MGVMIWKLVTSPLGRGLAALALVAAFLLWFDNRAYDRGYAAAMAERQSEIAAMQKLVDAASAMTRRQAGELEAYREAARMLAMETDNEILSDGNACVPTPDELQRARRRWSGSD